MWSRVAASIAAAKVAKPRGSIAGCSGRLLNLISSKNNSSSSRFQFVFYRTELNSHSYRFPKLNSCRLLTTVAAAESTDAAVVESDLELQPTAATDTTASTATETATAIDNDDQLQSEPKQHQHQQKKKNQQKNQQQQQQQQQQQLMDPTRVREIIRSYTPPQHSSRSKRPQQQHSQVQHHDAATSIVQLLDFALDSSNGVALEARDFANIIAACAHHRTPPLLSQKQQKQLMQQQKQMLSQQQQQLSPLSQQQQLPLPLRQQLSQRVVADHAYRCFCRLRDGGAASLQSHAHMLLILCRMKDAQRALEVADSFAEHGYRFPIDALSELLLLLANSGKDPVLKNRLEQLYSLYKEAYLSQSMRLPAYVYIEIAVLHCKLMSPDVVVAVLRDMTFACHELNHHTLQPLLSVALYMGDHTVLRVLTAWYAQQLHPSLSPLRFQRGDISRILTVAAQSSDKQLAVNAFKLLEKSGVEPSRSNYFCMLRALLLSHDVVSAIDLLQQMQRNGAEFSAAAGVPSRQLQAVRELLVSSIKGPAGTPPKESRWRTDNLYYELLERARNNGNNNNNVSNSDDVDDVSDSYRDSTDDVTSSSNINSSSESNQHSNNNNNGAVVGGVVPLIALDALVEAAGRMGDANRAVATFQEYNSLFHVTPEVSSFNALLRSCAHSPRIDTRALLAVFQQMESASTAVTTATPDAAAYATDASGPHQQLVKRVAVVPDSDSYSILIEALARAGELQVLSGVLEHMTTAAGAGAGAMPQQRALRRAAVAFAKSGDWEKVNQLLSLISTQLGSSSSDEVEWDYIPQFLQQRLDDIRQQQQLPPLQQQQQQQLQQAEEM